ncbi:MAG: hypothetical protein O3B01_27905 [Planctomycetota bacterium]|nr:hypothetical protein [Planctomycetota bacterium]MDA1142406.1 hypothetical protein [Planctomycetota bacterium]
MPAIRDHLWVWGHHAGSHNGSYGLPADSFMAPVEGAHYIGVPNLIMVTYGNLPKPPFDQYAIPMKSLNRVVWSILGDSSSTRNDEQTDLEHVIGLAEKFPNITGGIMDDFLTADANGRVVGRYSVNELKEFARALHDARRPLGLWNVLYEHHLEKEIVPYYEQCDVITFWTWKARDLPKLEERLSKAKELLPAQRFVLGCYAWDFGAGQPMALDVFKRQCELGLKWLREGKVEGLIFLATCIFDLEIDTVEWLRGWIAGIGDESI